MPFPRRNSLIASAMGVMTFNPRRQTRPYHCNLQNSPKTSLIFDRIILVINRLQQPVKHMNKCLWIIFCKHGSKVSDTRLLYRLSATLNLQKSIKQTFN